MDRMSWIELLLFSKDSSQVLWQKIADELTNLALMEDNPVSLHQETVLPDRLLSEAAYPLWEEFSHSAPRTSERLINTCSANDNCAVLILDALSLRELSLIVGEAKKRGIETKTDVTFSEVPSDTNSFAQALGVSARANLKDDGKSSGFKLFQGDCYTDVLGIPFADVSFPPKPRLVIWHSFLDEQLHNDRSVAEICSLAKKEFTGDGFWQMIDKLRQGRKLIITSDHGYGSAEHFSSEIHDPVAVRFLRTNFHAHRFAKISPPQELFLPPFLVFKDGYCVVTGQRKWKTQSGFPKACHGGMSLLEVASPWIEIIAHN